MGLFVGFRVHPPFGANKSEAKRNSRGNFELFSNILVSERSKHQGGNGPCLRTMLEVEDMPQEPPDVSAVRPFKVAHCP